MVAPISSPDPTEGRSSPASTSRHDVAWLGGGVVVLLIYWFAGVNGRVNPGISFAGGDLPNQFFPDYSMLAERLRAGELPQWNPMPGQPFLATLLPGAFYPARLLLLPFDVSTAMHVSTVLHLVVSLVATAVLCQALGTGILGALVGATIYVGIHALPALYWPPFLEAGAWVPIAALALVRLTATTGFGWAVVLGVSVGMWVLAGAYQHALYAIYGLAALGLAMLVDPARRGRLATPAMAACLGVAVLAAIATAAPQALPTFEWSAETVRSGAPLSDVQLDPYPWPRSVWIHMFVLSGEDNLQLVGRSVAVLALLGCLTQRRFGAVLLGATLLAGALCLGRGTPVFVLFRVLPGFSSFRLPDRLIFLVGFLAALGGAFGADWLARKGRIGGLLGLVGLAAVAWTLFAGRRITAALPWTVPPGSIGGPAALMSLIETNTDGGRTLLTNAGRVDGISVKHPGMHHVRTLQDYNPLSSRRLAAYLYAVVGKLPPTPEDPTIFVGFLPMVDRIVRPELLDAAAVRTVFIRASSIPLRAPPFEPVGTEQGWTLYRNPLAFPRAYTMDRARFVPDDATALAVVRVPNFQPRREVVLVGQPASETTTALAAGPPDSLRPARIVVDAPEHVVIQVQSERPTALVLTDPIAPGWSATVNGEPSPVLAANYLGRGVVVPRGESRVEFVYRAPGLRLGLTMAFVGWLAVAAILAVRVRTGAGASRVIP